MDGYCDDQVTGLMCLATAETRIRDMSRCSERAGTDLYNAANTLGHGNGADKDELKELAKQVTDLMLAADHIAARIEEIRREVRA